MLAVCEAAANEGIPVGLFGSSPEVLKPLATNLGRRLPALKIVCTIPSRFRRVSEEERDEQLREIKDTGTRILFVALGCPRQEVWVYENLTRLSMPMLAVGAAFDFHAGTLSQAPAFLQRAGLEWASLETLCAS
jgi:exopolysaccharide biosynthesis WecB/TagA/CpsF family protein